MQCKIAKNFSYKTIDNNNIAHNIICGKPSKKLILCLNLNFFYKKKLKINEELIANMPLMHGKTLLIINHLFENFAINVGLICLS